MAVVVGCDSGVTGVFSVSDGAHAMDLPPNQDLAQNADAGSATVVRLTSDSTRAAVGHGSGVIKIWDCKESRRLHNIRDHPDAILSLAIAKEDRVLASSSTTGTVSLHLIGTGAKFTDLSVGGPAVAAHTSLCFSPQAPSASSSMILAAACSDGSVVAWNMVGQQGSNSSTGRRAVLHRHQAGHRATGAAFVSPNTPNVLLSCGFDKQLAVIDIRTNKVSQSRLPDFPTCVSCHHDGALIAVGSEGGVLYVYDSRRLDAPGATQVLVSGVPVSEVCWKHPPSKPKVRGTSSSTTSNAAATPAAAAAATAISRPTPTTAAEQPHPTSTLSTGTTGRSAPVGQGALPTGQAPHPVGQTTQPAGQVAGRAPQPAGQTQQPAGQSARPAGQPVAALAPPGATSRTPASTGTYAPSNSSAPTNAPVTAAGGTTSLSAPSAAAAATAASASASHGSQPGVDTGRQQQEGASGSGRPAAAPSSHHSAWNSSASALVVPEAPAVASSPNASPGPVPSYVYGSGDGSGGGLGVGTGGIRTIGARGGALSAQTTPRGQGSESSSTLKASMDLQFAAMQESMREAMREQLITMLRNFHALETQQAQGMAQLSQQMGQLTERVAALEQQLQQPARRSNAFWF